MASLEEKRHTLAHLLAAAVLERYPHAKAAIGPAIDTGFYYDFDFSGGDAPGEAELAALQSAMEEILPSWTEMAGTEVSPMDARDRFKENPYKLEIIEGIVELGEPITLYTAGTFTDLCRGGHAEHPARDLAPDTFALDRIAGAYWRGDEKNPMLTRIYGLAFDAKEELAAYQAQREAAKERDHKKLGKELDLFLFSELVGPGLPLWTPRGTLVRHLLDDFVWQLRRAQGYEKVEIPHITKKELYETSGHWDKFKDELFRITTREGHEFAMKPMNCPHHTQIYARKQWSYRELPQRYANTTTCYRDEQSGELSGLSRVRAFAQDDAHVFCRMQDAKAEFLKVWDIVHAFYPAFGFELRVRLSTHDPAHPEQYLGDAERWEEAEGMLREIVAEKGIDALPGVGEAAFYGPKLDFIAQDSLGRSWQVATIQLDMNQPERFDLFCINEKGEKERIVMIHAAIMGSLDRFLSILIEHTAGNFPVWLAPIQARVLPISGDKHGAYAQEIMGRLKAAGVRADLDEGNESLGKRIRSAKQDKIPYLLVVGDAEAAAGTVAVESRDAGKQDAMALEAFLARIAEEVQERK
ncbi:MAG TPA: threonine--tRNA ligase [Candidatus Paceibacterota bacterium]|nr:threonine--tRNA ligase [Candidatus Paceibacterota bacterium]